MNQEIIQAIFNKNPDIAYCFNLSPESTVIDISKGHLFAGLMQEKYNCNAFALILDHIETLVNRVTLKKIKLSEIPTFIENYNIDNTGLLNIDYLGVEYQIINDLILKGIIENIDNIQIKFYRQNEDSENQRQEIIKQLNKTHIKVKDFPYICECWTLKDAVSTLWLNEQRLETDKIFQGYLVDLQKENQTLIKEALRSKSDLEMNKLDIEAVRHQYEKQIIEQKTKIEMLESNLKRFKH